MFKTQIFDTLKKYIGDYLYGFNPDQLKLGLLNGHIKLKGLTFRPDKINENLELIRSPVVLKAGTVGDITIEINYLDMSKSQVIIEDILVIVGPNFSEIKKKEDYVKNEEKFLQLAKKLEEYENSNKEESNLPDKRSLDAQKILDENRELAKLLNKALYKREELLKDDKKEESEFKDIFSKILKFDSFASAKVMIKNIHIRYEDDQLFPRYPISFGFLIELISKSILVQANPNIDIYIPLSKDAQSFGYYQQEKKHLDDFLKNSKNRKNLIQQVILNNIQIYMNSQSEMYIPYSLYEATLYSEHGIFEAMPPEELQKLMKQYLEHDDFYRYTLLKIERTECHVMLSSNLSDTNLQNYIILNNTVFNVNVNIKAVVIEDLLDVVNYFTNFNIWNKMANLKPSIRPVINKKLVESKESTMKLRKLILREWWRSVLWYLRVKKIMEEKRPEVYDDLVEEYENASWIKHLENFQPNKKTKINKTELSKKMFDQKKIFAEENKMSTLQTLEEKSKDSLKDVFIMGFVNASNINVALQKNNGKTFLLAKIEQVHTDVFKNIDFNSHNSGAFHVTSVRVFLYQNEKSKKIFEESPKKDINNFDFGTVRNRVSVLAGQQISTFGNVQGNQQQYGHSDLSRDSLADFMEPGKFGIFGSDDGFSTRTRRKETKCTDLLLAELKHDIIVKLAMKPLVNNSVQYQMKVEVNEINVNLETRILQDLIDYFREFDKIYYYRYDNFQKFMDINYKKLKYLLQKKVISFDAKANNPNAGKQSKIIASYLMNFQPSQLEKLDKKFLLDSNRYMYENKENEIGTNRIDPLKTSQFLHAKEEDFTEVFLNKLEAFLQHHEILVSVNLDQINVNLCENTHSVHERIDLCGLQLPKGKVVLSFNYNKRNTNIIDFYGFKLETSSRFQALYFLVKKIKNMINTEMEDQIDMNVKFFGLISTKGALKDPENRSFAKKYSTLKFNS